MTPPRTRSGSTSLLLLLFVAAAAFVAGGAAYHAYAKAQATTAAPTVKPQRPAELSGEAVVALGRIRPAGGLRPVSGPPGDQIAEMLVREGDTVTANQPIARLASEVDRRSELDLIVQQIADAEAQKQLARASGEREIAVAEAKLDEQTQLAPLELKAQEAKLQYLERQRSSAEQRLQGMRDLQRISPNTVSAQDVDAQDLLLAQTTAEIAAAKTLLSKATLAQKTGKQVAEAQLAAARANLDRSLREIPLETLAKKRDIAERMLARTQVLAPAGGRVVKVIGRNGDPTAPQQPIVELGDTGHMEVVAEVYETEVAKLRRWVGNGESAKATVQSRALPPDDQGKPTALVGTVKADRIGTVIARNAITDIDPTADADRRVFEVVVTLDRPTDAAVAAQFLNLQVQVFFEPPK